MILKASVMRVKDNFIFLCLYKKWIEFKLNVFYMDCSAFVIERISGIIHVG